jgi:hypothetical protein
MLERRKAWAELEREQDEVKRNIKSLMRLAPESRVLDDPATADRVRNTRMQPATYAVQEDNDYIEKKASTPTKKAASPKT